MPEYNSSESLQRSQHFGVFAQDNVDDEVPEVNENKRAIEILDKYIALHGSTTYVHSEMKKKNRTAEHQLDLSADIVKILEAIKKEIK